MFPVLEIVYDFLESEFRDMSQRLALARGIARLFGLMFPV